MALNSTVNFLRTIETFSLESGDVDYAAEQLHVLARAIADLKDSIRSPLLEMAPAEGGRQLDSSNVWTIRAIAAVGLECLNRGGLSLKDAAKEAEDTYKELRRLLRRNSSVASSLMNWRNQLTTELKETRLAFSTKRRLQISSSSFPSTTKHEDMGAYIVQRPKPPRR